MNIYDKLINLGIALPPPPPKGGVYRPVKVYNDKLAYTSGFGPIENGVPKYTGKMGSDHADLEYGREAAKLCTINALSALEKELGDLNKVKGVIKLLGFVASASDFIKQPEVINGASELLADIFGKEGEHARSAVATNVLPQNITVEIEIIFELK